MTLKHVKFEDSVTMRSLEKVARDKGWVKPEAIEKTASKAVDYSVTSNLTENVIKLCTGLRNSGFAKYADELEQKFMAYKKAESLYDTTKEKGEDLVDAAHPHGSHKLKDVDGDSVIETILDQQVKDLEMVNKKPSGKLSNAEAISKVKIALADTSDDLKKNLDNVVSSIQQINDFYYDMSFFNRPSSDPKKAVSLSKILATNPTKSMAMSLKAHLQSLSNTYRPIAGEYIGQLLGGVTQDVYNEMSPFFDFAIKSLDNVISILSKQEEPKPVAQPQPAAPVAPEVQSLLASFNDVKRKVRKYKDFLRADQPANMEALNQYLDKVDSYVNEKLNLFNSTDDANKVSAAPRYLSKLNSDILPGLNAFEGAYVKS